jgi:hypothetical protein
LGARVIIASRRLEHLEPTARALAAVAGEAAVMHRTCDIREPEQIAALVDAALSKVGPIDHRVNNAGGQFPAPAESMMPEAWDAVVRNNLNTFYMTEPQKPRRLSARIGQQRRRRDAGEVSDAALEPEPRPGVEQRRAREGAEQVGGERHAPDGDEAVERAARPWRRPRAFSPRFRLSARRLHEPRACIPTRSSATRVMSVSPFPKARRLAPSNV